MESLSRYQWLLFAIACGLTAASLVVHVYPYIPLYLSSDLRNRTSTLIQATAAREGWVRSGLSIVQITDDTVTLQYRSHLRGTDPVQCYELQLRSGLLSSCDS